MLVDDPVVNWCQKNLIDDDEASDDDDDMDDEDQGLVSVSYRVAQMKKGLSSLGKGQK